MVPRETVSFVFPRVLMFPETKFGENKTNQFPKGLYIKCFVIYLDFLLSNRAVVFSAGATTARLYPGRDTFEFDQGHVTKNQPTTVLISLNKVQLYNNYNYFLKYFLLPFYFFSITTLHCCSKFTFPHLQIKHMAALQTLLKLTTMSKQVHYFYISE